MDTTIICEFNLFDARQTISVLIDGEVKPVIQADINNLPGMISVLCDKNDTNKVHLFGAKEMLEPIAERIEEHYSINYGKKDLIIEVN